MPHRAQPPATLALLALLTSGCAATDPILGHWDMVAVDGIKAEVYPYVSTFDVDVDVDNDDSQFLGAFFMFSEANENALSIDFHGDRTGRGEYTFEGAVINGDSDQRLYCTRDDDLLLCDYDFFEFLFERS